MFHTHLRLAACGLAATAIGLAIYFAGVTPAQPGDTSTAKKPDAGALPIGKVILFSSGVGYFQREGEVTGDSRIDLAFPTANINDLLKSLVLQDLGGGKISTISYDSADPIEKTLKSFALDLTQNPSLADLLKQARGEKIEVVLPPASATPGSFNGTIIGLENRAIPAADNKTMDVAFVNLLTAKGIQSLRLDQVEKLSFLNPTMDNELKRALETLALSHDTQKKSVTLSFTGQGKRAVRVGYVIEHPIWKTSYRLVIGKDGKPLLQGWAIIENPTDEDWQNVKVTLVSGRPISFKMDLYQPLYVGRPTVEPELFASLRPPTYDGAMEGKERALAETLRAKREVSEITIKGGAAPEKAAEPGSRMNFGYRLRNGAVVDASALAGQQPLSDDPGLARRAGIDMDVQVRNSVASAASGQELGDFFQYAINQPVSITRKKSAMLPIINQAIQGAKVSIFNEAVHAKYPLHGLKLKNSSGLHLMQGPITVFEGDSYSGDARIMDLQPNEERLLSYAIDLGTEVSTEGKNTPDQITAAKIAKGVMEVTSKQRLTKTYAMKNRDDKARTLIIEHPIRQGLTLVKPEKPTEKSRDHYRFEQTVAPGDSARLEVVEDFGQTTQVALTGFPTEDSLKVFLTSSAVSEKVKEALRQAVKKWQAVVESERLRKESEQQLAGHRTDQAEARENLKTLPNTSAAYRRFLEKIDSIQNDIEKTQGQIKKLRDEEASKRREYEGFLANLTVE